MARLEDRLESGGRERRGAGEDDAQWTRRAAYAALRWRFFSLARTRFCFRSDR
jgi:hypothetical protein